MERETSWCPVCENPIPSHQIERHVNNHFDDDNDNDDDQVFAGDLELAHQIGVSPPSPPPPTANFNCKFNSLYSQCTSSWHPTTTSHSHMDDTPKHIDFQICSLLSLQTPAVFHKIDSGLINLLQTCLRRENFTTSLLSGYVDHFQTTWKEDMGWGCGWRNIQMLSSHLLTLTPQARDLLFAGSGFVPDIPSLQRWLEIAWLRGFDPLGSLHFNGKVYGSTNWIGTTECAALLRSFGFRANIVDFDANAGEKHVGRVYGPMDKFIVRSNVNTDATASKPSDDASLQTTKGYQLLIDWVWNYFCKDKPKESGNQNVVVTNKMPLYFQHQGHSRTIVGIQVKHQKNGMKQYNLLVLDPGHRTEALERSLRENCGWQKFLKRGLHTLRKPQYQLCYVDPGIAHGEEVEQLKTLQSVNLQS